MSSISVISSSVCCSRWAFESPLLGGSASLNQNGCRTLGFFGRCQALSLNLRIRLPSQSGRTLFPKHVVVSAVADTTEADAVAAVVEKPGEDTPALEGPLTATPEAKPARRRRQPKKAAAEDGTVSTKKAPLASGGEADKSAGAAQKGQKRKPRKESISEASPAVSGIVGEGGEHSEEAAAAGVESEPETKPDEAKQAAQKKRVYVQDAKRLKVSTKRAVALLHLLRIENDAAYASLLDRTGQQVSLRVVEKSLGLKIEPLSKPELRQVTELVSATTKWRRYLDYVIESIFAREGKKQKVKGIMKQLLRLGACEVLKLGQPSHVVNELVQLTKCIKGGGNNAAKFVNYVLRQVTGMKEAGKLPEPSVEEGLTKADILGIVHSQPTWIVERWLERYGEEDAVKFLEWNNAVPAFGVRPNAAKGITLEGFKEKLEELKNTTRKVEYTESPYLPTVLRVQNNMQGIREMLDEGICSVQDESAGLVVNLLDPTPGDFIVDTCAAPGGKAFHAAERLNGEGSILALDIHAARLQKLADVAKKMGLESVIETGAGDLRYLARNKPRLADKVLVDAPCTGLGVIARRADLRWRKSQDNLDELVKLQAELLDAAVSFVKPGGLLVYSTCSVEPEENEMQVEAFLERHPDFSIETATPYVPIQAVTARGFYATLPFRDGIDGAFGARLRRAAAP